MSFNIPLLSALIYERPAALAVSGFALVHQGLLLAGFGGWPCPILHLVGIPCPACGLSRGVAALVHGDWSAMVTYHAFAPLVACTLLLVVCAALLPQSPRQALGRVVKRIERRSGLTVWLILAFMFYWAVRFAIDPSGFIALMQA